MLRIKNSLIKKAIAAGLMIATVMGTSIPTFASEWHSNASGHAEYDIYQDGRFDESISVITSLDEYGNISDDIY